VGREVYQARDQGTIVNGRRVLFAVIPVTVMITLGTLLISHRGVPGPGTTSARVCAGTNSVPALHAFGRLIRQPVACAVIFAEAVTSWAQWTHPWFLSYYHRWPRFDWESWYKGGDGSRTLVLTLDLIPVSTVGPDWAALGAAGDFTGYDKVLARRLVAAGMGNIIIRLGHEANGTSYEDSLGTTASARADWIAFWRRTVFAMRSVPGAHFRFDWCVNAGYRAIPLQSFYPGNDVVDLIGVDAYDSTTVMGPGRVSALLSEPDGLSAVAAFARQHHKPMSIPEWGISPAGNAEGIGDDPQYVRAIAQVTRTDNVAYQSYFFSNLSEQELVSAPRSLADYRSAFAPKR
jgi:hypothetical protein